MKHKKVFIVITHIKQVKDGETNMVEKCEFVDNLTLTHETSASVILDYVNETVIKDRTKLGSYGDFYWHVIKNYPQQMNELAQRYKDSNNDE